MDLASSEHAFLVLCHLYDTLLVCLGVAIEIYIRLLTLHNTSLLQAQVVDCAFALVGICSKIILQIRIRTSYAMAGVLQTATFIHSSIHSFIELHLLLGS